MELYRRDPDLVTREIAGETVIVPICARVGDLDSTYVINEVGSAIWRRLDGATSVEGIAAALTEEYDVAAGEAASDVREFLASLMSAGLVRAAQTVQ